MKIVIAGAGAVGTHLAKLLVKEHHDITLIDADKYKLEALSNNYDLLTVCDNPSSLGALRTADVGKADLFIAVTPDESHNMTCCMFAKQLGAKRTVARVDNYEYTLAEHQDFFRTAGISSIIYPELLAGREIAHNVRRSWVRQWWEFQDGALLLLGIKVRKGAPILDRPLREVCLPETPWHIVALKHDGETYIPHGNDCVRENDLVFFMTTAPYVDSLREVAGKERYSDVKRLFIMGGTNTALHIVENLPHGIHSKIFERDYKRSAVLYDLVHDYPCEIVNADGSDIAALVDENVQNAQAFAAVTNNSEANILACLAAKRLGVHKTIAMVENTDYVPMAESLDIGTIINKKTFAAAHIYQMMLRADVSSIKSLTIAAADVAEIKIPENARITHRPIRELDLPATVNLGGIVRDGKGILINGNTIVEPGDVLVAFALNGELPKLERFMKPMSKLFGL